MNQMEPKKKRVLIIAAIVWLINLIVLTNIIGENGAGYLAPALECSLAFFIITIYALPDAMAKLMKSRIQKGQEKNAAKVFHCALFLALIYLGAGALFFLVFPEFFMKGLFHMPYSTFTFSCMFPTYCLGVFIQILRGYFQGMGSLVPTMVSQILNRIFAFLGCIAGALLFVNYGEKVSKLLLNEEFSGKFGSAGVITGFAPAALFMLLFLLFTYITNKRNLNRMTAKDSGKNSENSGEIIYVLFLTMLPQIITALFYLTSPLWGIGIYGHMPVQNELERVNAIGIYYGQYLPVVFLCIMLLLLLCVPLESGIIIGYRREEYRHAKERLSALLHYLVLAGGFLTAVTLVLAKPLLMVLYRKSSDMSVIIFQEGACVILLGALAACVTDLLLSIGKQRTVLINGAVSFAIFIISNILFISVLKWGIYGVLGADIVFLICVVFMNSFMLMKSIRFKIDWIYAFLIPIGTAALTGVIMFLLNKALNTVIGELFTLIAAVVFGLIVYLLMLLALKGFREAELKFLPGGKIVRKIGTMLHLL